MIEPEKTVRVIRETGRDRTRESSLAHLEQGFLPINMPILRAIRSESRAGVYERSPELLVRDVKQDVGLIAHCIRSIPQILSNPSSRLDPLGDLPKLNTEQLEFLLTSAEKASKHDLSKAAPQCVKRMRHAILACAGTETLVEAAREKGVDIDRGTAFSVSYLRQLGMQLVAWNYPKIYSRAVDEARRGGSSIEEYIDGVLPQPVREISLAIAQDWKLHSDLLGLISYRPRGFDDSAADRAVLNKLVQFAETFAQLDSQDLYPQAASQWLDAVPELAEIVGDDVVKFLPERVRQACEQSLFQLETVTRAQRPEKIVILPLPSVRGQKYLEENKELRRAPILVQGMLRQVYGCIAEQGASKESLQRLISEVIPAAGFARGCIYGVATEPKRFVPLLWLNDKRGSYFDPQEFYSPWAIADAMSGEVPLLKTIPNAKGDAIQFLSGLFGHPAPKGVLFLEITPSAAPELIAAANASFRAVRVALYDCLRIE